MAVTKRNAEDPALPEQRRDNVMELDSILNQTQISQPSFLPIHSLMRNKKDCKNLKKTGGLRERVWKHNIVAELTSVPTGMKFRQLLRGDAEEARETCHPNINVEL